MRKINLNLLMHLDALLKEKQVSNAAKRVCITQPAMSASLKLLREMFSDPLLVKIGNQFELTQKALKLLPEVDRLMENVDALLEREIEFSPDTLDKMFTLSMPNYLQTIVMPKLQAQLQDYPNIRFNVVDMSIIDEPSIYEFNKVDLAIGTCTRMNIPEALSAQKLFEQELVCYCSASNPVLHQALTLENYLNAPHVTVSFNTELYNPLQQVLKQKKLNRNDVMYVDGFLATANIVANSDRLISSAPKFFIKMVQNSLNLNYQKVPLNVATTSVYIGYHKKFASNPALLWLRSKIINILEAEVIQKYQGVKK